MAAQVWLNTNLIHLQSAVLCANCEVISEALNGHCACCGSESLLSLSRVLGGTIGTELAYALTASEPASNENVQVWAWSAAA